jgi:hypothetical protein
VGFCKKRAKFVVLWWTKRGELRGKRGELWGDFQPQKNRTPISEKESFSLGQLLLFEGKGEAFPFGEEGDSLGAEPVEFGGGTLGVFR